MEVFYVFAAIVAVFFALLLAKEVLRSKKKLCLLCASISLTWMALLILYWKGYFDNIIVLSMLIGQSTVGIFYLVEKKAKEELHLFKVPFLLTLTFLFYLLLDFPDDFIKVFVLLAVFWIAFIGMFIFRKNNRIRKLVKKLIECCKRW